MAPPPPAAPATGSAPCALAPLTSLGIAPQFVTFTHVTMESDKYICVRETSPQNSVVVIDMAMPMQPLRRPITADSTLMNPNTRILALKYHKQIQLESMASEKAALEFQSEKSLKQFHKVQVEAKRSRVARRPASSWEEDTDIKALDH